MKYCITIQSNPCKYCVFHAFLTAANLFLHGSEQLPWDILNESLLEYAIVLVFTTIFVMVVVGAVPQTIAKRLVKMEEDFTEE